MEEFKVGEIVQLKSGGPKMTVDNADNGPSILDDIATSSVPRYIHCQWFAGNKLESGSFKPQSLKKVAEDDKTGR